MKLQKQGILVRGGDEKFAERFEEPQELVKVLPLLTMDELWWVIENYALSNDEIVTIYQRLGIHDSDWVIKSTDIDRSFFVTDSSNIEDCHYIFNCHDVYESSFCWNSKRIHESHFVKEGKELIRATRCLDCKNSDDVAYSQRLNFCNDIWISSDLIGCSHCICCFDLENAEYQIFNHEVRPQVFARAANQLRNLLITSDEVSYSVAQSYFQNRYWFNFLRLDDLTEPVLDFITNLPYYSSEVMRQITRDVRWNLYGSENDS